MNAYKLALPPWFKKLHNVFHVSFLKPYWDIAQNPALPEGTLVDDVVEYEVKEIQLIKGPVKNHEYYVKWKGYLNEECTWEPPDSIQKMVAFKIFMQNPVML